MSQKDVLLIFVKNPILGSVKTRLGETIGNRQALEVYLKLLYYTKNNIEKLNCEKKVCYDKFVDERDIWNNSIFFKQKQTNGSLGNRMKAAFQAEFINNANKVVIIGSDCPEITPDIINQAFLKLDTHNTVIGPATDGGYYLLGMREFIPEVFENKSWSTSTVKDDTIKDLNYLNKKYYILPFLQDIDTEEDYKRFKSWLDTVSINYKY